MKDRRNYLKLACVTELLYLIVILIYNLFFKEFNDEVLASLFFALISSFILIILYKESKKDLDYFKHNKLPVLFSGIWFFFEPIIPGVFCFLFLSSLKEKKKLKLPDVKEEKGKKNIIKSTFYILFFLFAMYFPFISFLSNSYPYIIYLVILAITFALYFNELKGQFKIFAKNIKVYFPFIIKRYFIMLGIMFLVALPLVIINKGEVATNQQALNVMFEKIPLVTLLLTSFYAPLVEESVFRLSLSKFFKNKTLFIIISGFFFGSLHVIDKFTTLPDFLYIFQYSALGMCLAKAYVDSKNIFVPIFIHFIQNFLSSLLVILLF